MARGVAMHAHGDCSGVQCFNCGKCSHYKIDCPWNSDKNNRGHSGGKPHWKKNGGRGATTVEEGVAAAVKLAVDAGGGQNGAPSTTPPITATNNA